MKPLTEYFYYRQLPSVKKGSLSNSSSDYGLDESYNSADETTDSAFFQSNDVKTKSNHSTRSSNTATYSTQQTLNNLQNSQYIVQYSEVQKFTEKQYSEMQKYSEKQHSEMQKYTETQKYSEKQHSETQKSGHYGEKQYSERYTSQNSGAIYSKVQKEGREERNKELWGANVARPVSLTGSTGPPASLAEQLKQVGPKIFFSGCNLDIGS